MLSELLPTTGYLTDMHWFTFISTVLVVLIAASHVFIFAIQSKAVAKRELLRRIAQLRKSRRTQPAVAMVQRQVRIHLARKSIQERKQLLSKQQQALEDPATVPGTATGTARGAGRYWVSRRVSPLGTGEPQEEAQAQKKAEHAVLSLLSAYRAPSKDNTIKGKMLRIYRELNDVVELFCVNVLTWINWLVATVFVIAYIIILMTVFKGAGEGCL